MEQAERSEMAAMMLRVSLGVMFLAHAYLKFFVFTLAGTVGFFESVGFPGFLGYVVPIMEGVGGAALILGVQVRLVSLSLIPILLGAAYVHWGNGWVFSAKGGGWEYPAFLAAATGIQALLGNGAFALKIPGVSNATQQA